LLTVEDVVGVCMGDSLETTKLNFLFTGAETEPCETPFEIIGSQVELPLGKATPVGSVEVQFTAT